MTATEKEALRHAALENIVARRPAALPAPGIRRRLAVELDFHYTDEQLAAELEFLRDKGLIKFELDELGSTRWWSATAAGVLAVERQA